MPSSDISQQLPAQQVAPAPQTAADQPCNQIKIACSAGSRTLTEASRFCSALSGAAISAVDLLIRKDICDSSCDVASGCGAVDSVLLREQLLERVGRDMGVGLRSAQDS